MLALVITACLQADPSVCRTHELPIFEPVSAVACTMQAPAEIARWKEGRDDLRVTRWRCVAEREPQSARR